MILRIFEHDASPDFCQVQIRIKQYLNSPKIHPTSQSLPQPVPYVAVSHLRDNAVLFSRCQDHPFPRCSKYREENHSVKTGKADIVTNPEPYVSEAQSVLWWTKPSTIRDPSSQLDGVVCPASKLLSHWWWWWCCCYLFCVLAWLLAWLFLKFQGLIRAGFLKYN